MSEIAVETETLTKEASRVIGFQLISGEWIIGELLGDFSTYFVISNPLTYRIQNTALGASAMLQRYAMYDKNHKISFKEEHVLAKHELTGVRKEYYYIMLKYIQTFIDTGFDSDIEAGIENVNRATEILNNTQQTENQIVTDKPANVSVDSIKDFFSQFGGEYDPKKLN